MSHAKSTILVQLVHIQDYSIMTAQAKYNNKLNVHFLLVEVLEKIPTRLFMIITAVSTP